MRVVIARANWRTRSWTRLRPPRLLERRGLLKLVAGAGLAGAGLITLGGAADTEAPGGSNGANVLTESGIVRSDIRSSFSSSTTKAEGIPVIITMTINEFANDKNPLAGGAVYLWHCDPAGQYSLCPAAITQEDYLRGVQEADDQGQVSFTTIFPACYNGRWPHIHFELYPSLAKATNSANKVATSQMGLTEETVQRQCVQRRLRPADPHHHRSPASGYQFNFTCAVR
jgi:protocatechuate 3,4-dioxygenase beta subunit